MLSWRGKERSNPGRTFQAAPGFRDSEVPPLTVGEVVASAYQVRQPLARTAAGAVFEAWDMLVERPVALTIAWRDPGTPPLVLEARRAAAVRDPAAVAVHAVLNHRGAELVVAERVAGRTVADLAAAYLHAAAAMPCADLLEILGAAATGLAAAHAAGVAVGDVGGETVLVAPAAHPGTGSAIGRVVLGGLALGQVPARAAAGVAWAPEVITGQQRADDPAARPAIDAYGLGCLAVELATCRPPFLGDSVKATQFGHVHHRPPNLAELRPDLPVELGDLVVELLDKHPSRRPLAATAAAHLRAIAERAAATRRIVRILIVDDDADRVRALWSVLRRAHPRATVDAARDGTEAVGKLRRDRPDLVVVDSRLAGTMNALELCMYLSGLEDARGATVAAIVDDVDSADTGALMRMGAQQVVSRDAELPGALGELVRGIASAPRFAGATGRITVSG